MGSYGDLSFVTKKDQNPVKGIEFPVRSTSTGGIFSRNFNEQSVKDGLIQLIMTQRGERPMRYDYGTDVRGSVFAPMDSLLVSNLESSIRNAIDRYEPRVVIRDLQVISDEQNSSIDIKLVFSMKDNVFFSDQVYLTVNPQGVEING